MLEIMDIVIPGASVGPVGNFKAFRSPILNSGLVEFIVFGGDDDLWSSFCAIVRRKHHARFLVRLK